MLFRRVCDLSPDQTYDFLTFAVAVFLERTEGSTLTNSHSYYSDKTAMYVLIKAHSHLLY